MMAFIEDGGYRRPELWLSMGWDWVQQSTQQLPLYWQLDNGHKTICGPATATFSHLMPNGSSAVCGWHATSKKPPTRISLKTP
jgi:formylglycine-generating enzyme required for sulfatase activity